MLQEFAIQAGKKYSIVLGFSTRISLTLLFVIHPTNIGPIKPGIAANIFVIPTKVPTSTRDQSIIPRDLQRTNLRSY